MTRTKSRARAIRLKCLDCCAGQPKMVRDCPCQDCTLWIWRMGHFTPKKDGVSETKQETDTTKPIPPDSLENNDFDEVAG